MLGDGESISVGFWYHIWKIDDDGKLETIELSAFRRISGEADVSCALDKEQCPCETNVPVRRQYDSRAPSRVSVACLFVCLFVLTTPRVRHACGGAASSGTTCPRAPRVYQGYG